MISEGNRELRQSYAAPMIVIACVAWPLNQVWLQLTANVIAFSLLLPVMVADVRLLFAVLRRR